MQLLCVSSRPRVLFL